MVPQFAIQQQQKRLLGDLRIFRKLGCDAHFRHLGKWQLLLHLPPLPKVVFDLLRDRLLARSDIEKQNRLRLSRTQYPPGARGSRRILAAQLLRQFLAVFFDCLPGSDKLLVRNQALNLRKFLFSHPFGQKINGQRRRIGRKPYVLKLLPRFHPLRHFVLVNLCRGPLRMQHLQPALFFERLHDMQRVVLEGDLPDFIPDTFPAYMLDVVVLFGRFVASFRPLFQLPVETRRKARRPNQAGRIFQEGVIVQHADEFSLHVGRSIERVEQQPPRAGIERKRNRVDGEVAPPQIFVDGGWNDLRRGARFAVDFRARHADFHTHSARQHRMQGLGFLADDFDLRSAELQILLQFQGIALDREIEIADGQSGQDVTNRPARQIHVHAVGAGRFLYQAHRL